MYEMSSARFAVRPHLVLVRITACPPPRRPPSARFVEALGGKQLPHAATHGVGHVIFEPCSHGWSSGRGTSLDGRTDSWSLELARADDGLLAALDPEMPNGFPPNMLTI